MVWYLSSKNTLSTWPIGVAADAAPAPASIAAAASAPQDSTDSVLRSTATPSSSNRMCQYRKPTGKRGNYVYLKGSAEPRSGAGRSGRGPHPVHADQGAGPSSAAAQAEAGARSSRRRILPEDDFG